MEMLQVEDSISGLELGDLLGEREKPNWEWIAGRAVQKLMPTDWHSFLQFEFCRRLFDWAPQGKVGPEWRITPSPNDYETRSMVPDVVYLSAERYYKLPKTERRYPTVAPDIVIAILSPRQSMGEMNIKRRVCLWWGVKLVLVVDPYSKTLHAYDAQQPNGLAFTAEQQFTSDAFPTLRLPLAEIFAVITEVDEAPYSIISA